MWYFRPLIILGGIALVAIFLVVFAIQMFQNGSVVIQADLKLESNTLIIKGTTNLPNRALISYEVAYSDEDRFKEEGVLASGITLVKDGKFRAELNTRFISPGTLIVWVRFVVTPAQPLKVQADYGAHGENLKGPKIKQSPYNQWIEISKTIEIN